MPAEPGCPYCKVLTSRLVAVHDDHITHVDEAHHHIACPTPPCGHYAQETS